jgi:hypothetical protein
VIGECGQWVDVEGLLFKCFAGDTRETQKFDFEYWIYLYATSHSGSCDVSWPRRGLLDGSHLATILNRLNNSGFSPAFIFPSMLFSSSLFTPDRNLEPAGLQSGPWHVSWLIRGFLDSFQSSLASIGGFICYGSLFTSDCFGSWFGGTRRCIFCRSYRAYFPVYNIMLLGVQSNFGSLQGIVFQHNSPIINIKTFMSINTIKDTFGIKSGKKWHPVRPQKFGN